MTNDISNYIESSLGGILTGSNSEYSTDCVACGKENHMYINADTGLVHCFVCGYSANLVKLLQDLEGLPWDRAFIKSTQLLQGIAKVHTHGKSLDDIYLLLIDGLKNSNENKIELPKRCVPICDQRASVGRSYLSGRGFDSAHYLLYNLLFIPETDEDEKRFRNHIVFPEYDEHGNLIYYTTRAAYEPQKKIPKSYHPKGMKASVFGMSVIPDEQKICILVEGPMDVLALPRFGVALLGSSITEMQAWILKKRFEKIILFLDPDVSSDKKQKIVNALQKKNIVVYDLNAPFTGDPASFVTTQNPYDLIQNVLSKVCAVSSIICANF